MNKRVTGFFAWLLRFSRQEPLLVLAAIACFAVFSFFGEVVEEVLEGDSHALDEGLLLLLRDPGDSASPLGPGWLEEMMRDLTGMGGIVILSLFTIAAVFYLLIRGMKGQALYLIAATGTGILLSNLLKIGFDRPRPDLVPHGSYTAMSSFPSGHSLMAAVVYLTLGVILAEAHKERAIRIYFVGFAILLAVLVGVSRVYLGVHWPSDVLAGWLVGAGWALLFWIIDRYLKIRGRLESEADVENSPQTK